MNMLFVFALVALFIYGLGSSLLPLVLAGVGAILSRPLIDWLKSKGVKTTLAALLIILLLALPLTALIVFLAPLFIDELKDFLSSLPQNLANFVDQMETLAVHVGLSFDYSRADVLELVNRHAAELSANLLKIVTDTLKRSAGNLTGLILATLNLFLVPVFFFYLISENTYWRNLLLAIVPREHHDRLSRTLTRSVQVLKAYLQGQSLACLTLSALYATGLSIVGLRFGLVIGMMTGMLSFMPYVGFSLGLFSGVIVAFSMGQGFGFVFLVVGVFLLVQFLESFVVTPRLVGNIVGLTPLESILILIVFGNLLGFAGMLVAIPTGAIFKAAVLEYFSASTLKGEQS